MKIKYFKTIFELFVVVLTLTACYSEDEDRDSMKVSFLLMNEEGEECYDFKEGKNIIFRLQIDNNTDNVVILPSIFDIIGTNIFHIYSINGEDLGTPWDELFGNSSGKFMIDSNGSAVVLCPWFDVPSLSIDGHDNFYSGCFCKTKKKASLPKGEYYSKFDIKLREKTITCYRTFIIR